MPHIWCDILGPEKVTFLLIGIYVPASQSILKLIVLLRKYLSFLTTISIVPYGNGI